MGAVNEAGGDWYDIISLGGGDVALVIGDVVEGRRRSLDDGLRQLRRATANGPRDLDELCDHVVRALCQGTVEQDDIVLLAVRMHHPPESG